MGACLSRKGSTTPSKTPCPSAISDVSSPPPPDPNENKSCDAEADTKTLVVEQESVKKEVFVIKHRKSHDSRPEDKSGVIPTSEAAQICNKITATSNNVVINGGGSKEIVATAPVRTSSCTKEEVDAILIQCGRLSRSSSGKAASGGRKYSGSKRSYDFDHRDGDEDGKKSDSLEDDCEYAHNDEDRSHRHRHRRQSRASSHERRRTPSRERDQHQQRSGSRDRASSGGGRRVSRSPGRRSESNLTASGNNSTTTTKPGKLVSIPATVSSLAMDKSNNGGVGAESTTTAAVKRVNVKRNVGAASPRAQSPAKTNGAKVSNENQQPSLSRNSSRKAERSPYRRNPLGEIDTNSIPVPQAASSNKPTVSQKPNVEEIDNTKVVAQGTNTKSSSRGVIGEAPIERKGLQSKTNYVEVAAVTESQKPPILTRSRSSRRSRDLDHINPEALLNPTSYTTLLLEDIQNFHQKNNTTSFSLPACVTKACSILDAVADLNSCTSALSEEKKTPPQDQSNKNNFSKGLETRDPFVESELVVEDDIMEPSLHKYVTVRRGVIGGGEMEEQESSGSNSFAGSQQHWGSSSWEPNSADSTDCWTSRSNSKEEDPSPPGFSRSVLSETGGNVDGFGRRLSAKKRDFGHQQIGLTRGKAAAST